MQPLNERLLTTDRSILDIGPEFKVTSQIDATFRLDNINAAVGLNYNLSGVSFVFPPQNLFERKWDRAKRQADLAFAYYSSSLLLSVPHILSQRQRSPPAQT